MSVACLPTYLPTYLLTYLPTYLPCPLRPKKLSSIYRHPPPLFPPLYLKRYEVKESLYLCLYALIESGLETKKIFLFILFF